MSLVLEAMRKQEAGSDPAAALSIARSATRQRRQRLWIALFAAAMAANVALFAWVFVVPGRRAPDGTPPADAAARAGPHQTAPAAGRPKAGQPEPSIPAVATTVAVPPQSGPAGTGTAAVQAPPGTPLAARTPSEPAPTRLRLSELPAAARERFPGLVFSTHVYSEHADLRAVVANGHRLREGDRIKGLEVTEITPDGVVVAFGRYLVEIPIVTDWDAL